MFSLTGFRNCALLYEAKVLSVIWYPPVRGECIIKI